MNKTISEVFDVLKLLNSLSYVKQEETKVILSEKLNEIPLNKMNYEDSIDLLVNILQKCCEYNFAANIVEIVFERWSGHEFDVDGVLGDLMSNATCSFEILKYLKDVFKLCCPLTILDTHIRTRYGTGSCFPLVVQRTLKTYGVDNLDDFEWLQLIDAAEDTKTGFELDPKFIDRQNYSVTRDNKDVIEYIQNKMNENAQKVSAEKPKWILSDLDLDSESDSKNPNLNLMKEITKFIHIKNPDEFGFFESKSESKINEIFELDRKYGPINPILNSDSLNLNPSDSEEEFESCNMLVGPCRMLMCLCRENEEDDDEINVSYEDMLPEEVWFIGHCEVCHKSIDNHRYALRFPLLNGGWVGCFCSFSCMKKSEKYEYNIHCKELEKSLIQIGILEKI